MLKKTRPEPRIDCSAEEWAARVDLGSRHVLGRRGGAHRGAHAEIDPMHSRHLGLPTGQHALGIMRLNPALEEARRNRKVDAFRLDAFQVHPRKPARIDVFSDGRAQPTLHA